MAPLAAFTALALINRQCIGRLEKNSFRSCRRLQRLPPCLEKSPVPGTDEPQGDSGSFHANKDSTPSLQVFDGVFSSEACDTLHDLATDHQLRAGNSDGSSIFCRPSPDLPLTPLEQAIDSALTELNDTSSIVEYWSREEYLNIDAHADIDEGELEDEETLRCPTWGHVLYLKVGKDVCGPTCIFPNKLIGWGCLGDKKMADESGNDESAKKCASVAVEMVTVPAVVGRVLRFDGKAMHAVPKPADRWLLTDVEENNLRLDEKEGYNDDDAKGYNEDEAEDGDTFEEDELRSVLLFNTWSDGPPPRGVDGDPATGALPSGIELANDDNEDGCSNDSHNYPELDLSEDVEDDDDHSLDAVDIRCNARPWKQAFIPRGSLKERCGNHQGTVRVNLMGEKERRCHPKQTARMHTDSVDVLRNALHETEEPTRLVLLENNEQ